MDFGTANRICLRPRGRTIDSRLSLLAIDSTQLTSTIVIAKASASLIRVLYLATIVAIRHNPTIKAFYVHLKSNGKESKVAIDACMRKLVTILNLLVKSNQIWQTKRATQSIDFIARDDFPSIKLFLPRLCLHRASVCFTLRKK